MSQSDALPSTNQHGRTHNIHEIYIIHFIYLFCWIYFIGVMIGYVVNSHNHQLGQMQRTQSNVERC